MTLFFPPWGGKKALLKGRETQKCYHAINKKEKVSHIRPVSVCQVPECCSAYVRRGDRVAESLGNLRPFTFSHGYLHQDLWFCYRTIS